MFNKCRLLFTFSLLLFTGCGPRLVRVLDGDTFEVEFPVRIEFGVRERVRVDGIDAPDRGEPCREEAKARLAEELERGFFLEREPGRRNREKYGRLLRHVRISDGRQASEVLAGEGLAEPKDYGDPSQLAEQIEAAAKRAPAPPCSLN